MTRVLNPLTAPVGPVGAAGHGPAGDLAPVAPPRVAPPPAALPPVVRAPVAPLDPLAAPPPIAAPQVRLGVVGLGSAAVYLLIWALVLFAVSTAVFVAGYLALERFGVLTSLSQTAATVLSQPLPESGVLPVLELSAVLPYALVGSGVLALLWLVASLAFVCVHNAVSTLTGGLRVRVR